MTGSGQKRKLALGFSSSAKGQKQKCNLFRESLEDSHNWQNVAYLISLIRQISAWFKNYPVFSFENASKNKELVSFIGWGPNGKRLAF